MGRVLELFDPGLENSVFVFGVQQGDGIMTCFGLFKHFGGFGPFLGQGIHAADGIIEGFEHFLRLG